MPRIGKAPDEYQTSTMQASCKMSKANDVHLTLFYFLEYPSNIAISRVYKKHCASTIQAQ